jgi:hypothetical protein
MPTTPNPQRVALAKSAKGEPVFIEREWLRFLNDAAGNTTTPGGAPVDLSALQTQINALAARVLTLERELQGLSAGYQL